MSDKEKPDVLVQRLHSLAVSNGLTVKEMAEKCGVPKSSLEGYMRLKGAKRPGADALIAIANSMDVSVDWLLGRTNERHASELDRKQIALSFYSILRDILREIDEAQSEKTEVIVRDGKVGLYNIDNFSEQWMIQFVVKTNLFPSPEFNSLSLIDQLFEETEEL